VVLPNGQSLNYIAGGTFTPTSPGCYTFSGKAYFDSGQVLSAAHSVSVGGVTCGGQG
jgi:hypothetical protein